MKLQLGNSMSIDKSQLVEVGGGARCPALQATTYEPSKPSETIGFALSPEVVELGLLTTKSIELLVMKPIVACYASAEVEMLEITTGIRWIILSKPRIFGMDKADKKIYPIEQGVRLKDLGRVTIVKLFLAAIIGDEMLMADDGTPQLFTFRLKSTNTMLVSNRQDPKMSTIDSLNRSLQKHFAAPTSWCAHFVSVGLQPYAEKKTSSADASQSKIATSYRFVGAAIPVPQKFHAAVYSLISSPEFMAMAADPFRIHAPVVEALPIAPHYVPSDDDFGYAEQ